MNLFCDCGNVIYNCVCNCLSCQEERISRTRRSNDWKGRSSCTIQSIEEEDSSTDASLNPNERDKFFKHSIWVSEVYSLDSSLASDLTAFTQKFNLLAIWKTTHLNPDSRNVHRNLESTEVGKYATTALEDHTERKKTLMTKTSLPDNQGSAYIVPYEAKRHKIVHKDRPKRPIKYLSEINIGFKGEKERVSFQERF